MGRLEDFQDDMQTFLNQIQTEYGSTICIIIYRSSGVLAFMVYSEYFEIASLVYFTSNHKHNALFLLDTKRNQDDL